MTAHGSATAFFVRRRPSLGAALLLLAATLFACKKQPTQPAAPPPKPTPALGEITIHDRTSDQERPAGARLDVPSLTTQVREALTVPGLFHKGGAQAAPVLARVRIEIGYEDVVADDKAAARAAVRLRIDTRPSEVAADHWNEDVQAGSETIYKPSETPDRPALFAKLVARTVSDLIAGYAARQRLWIGDEAAVRAAVKGEPGDLRLEAMRVAGERKLIGVGNELLALLDESDEATRDAALGALVELRDRRAVSALAGSKSLRDRREMRKILDAISVLGGDEASEYLAFVAEGHDDQEIRTMATEARTRLQRRVGQAPGDKPTGK